MCGFIASFGQDINEKGLETAFDQLKRRGPDADGIWKEDNVFLGSKRLAIFDLNERSNQPMISICKRYILVFNGAIYNYLELRNYLSEAGVKLKTMSDTEVILELYALEGPKMLSKLEGMFSFVIWDTKKKEAFAARDPYGIKPLYIGYSFNGIILASQVKTLLLTNLISKDKDLLSQICFFKFGFVKEPRTWFKNIKSLRSGHYIKIKDKKIVDDNNWINFKKFWDLADKNKNKITKDNLKKTIYNELTLSVNKHLIADVPIGLFLSSGIDSALLATLVSLNKKKNITAITVLFEDFKNSNFDESIKATKIAEKLGLKHIIFKVTKDDFFRDLPLIMDAMDQPSIDGINVWYASKAAAKNKLKVVFSGLGGDEIFFGYDHFKKIPSINKYFNILRKIPLMNILLENFFKLYSFIKNDDRWKYIIKSSRSVFELWLLKRTIFTEKYIFKEKFLNGEIDLKKFESEIKKEDYIYSLENPKIKLSYLDSNFYMKNQLLRDSDWASMYHGVEIRTPLVDVNLLKSLKDAMYSYSFLQNKEILKTTFKEILPKEYLQRKKIGFQTPIKIWIKDNLKIKNKTSKNYLQNYMLDIKDLFNKY